MHGRCKEDFFKKPQSCFMGERCGHCRWKAEMPTGTSREGADTDGEEKEMKCNALGKKRQVHRLLY